MLVLAYFWLPTSTMHRRNLAKQIRCFRIFWQFWRFKKINIVEFVTKNKLKNFSNSAKFSTIKWFSFHFLFFFSFFSPSLPLFSFFPLNKNECGVWGWGRTIIMAKPNTNSFILISISILAK
jgi:hypothetical protein